MPEATDPQHDRKPALDRRDWYSLSLDTVRSWVIFLVVIGLLAIGFVGYRITQSLSLERQAASVIDEAEQLLTRVQNERGVSASSDTYNEAWQNLQQARRQLTLGDHREALVSARWSRNLFSSLLDDLRNRAPSGEAQFVGVQGGVEFRRGDGPWQVARSRLVLRSGDYVKTSGSGSAEVAFSDGSVFQVRPDTVILINRRRTEGGVPTEDAVSLEYGWVNLDTTDRASSVRTPEAEARVAQRSRAEVSYDRSRRRSTFSSFQGNMEVRTRIGTVRRLGSMEQLVQTAAGLSAPVALPASPALLTPEADAIFDLANEQMVLRWQRVAGASRYALQICRDTHFVDNIIDVEDRSRTVATVGLLGEGTFLWRVAAFTRQGNKGPWSDHGVFKVEGEPAGNTGRTEGATSR